MAQYSNKSLKPGLVIKSHSFTIDGKQDSGNHPPTVNANNASITRISKGKEIAGSEVMTLQELATYLCVPKATVYRLVQRGGFPAFKVGR